MQIFYEGTEISSYVLTRQCIVTDTAEDRCDLLELEFENAEGWYRWGPQEDDRISVRRGEYDSGTMYLNTVVPEDGKYRVLATALPCRARSRASRSYRGRTLEEILRSCSMGCGMDFQCFGIDKDVTLPYFERDRESAAAFLLRLLRYEGAALKCVNGKFSAIGILWAQSRPAQQSMRLTADLPGLRHRRSGAELSALTVRTPYAEATAEDTAVPGSRPRLTEEDAPALDRIQAGRWARHLLLDKNRRCECLTLSTEFNEGLSALMRIDTDGQEELAGSWLIQEVRHDLIRSTSAVSMHRCVETIR